MHTLAGKQVEVKSATPKGSGPIPPGGRGGGPGGHLHVHAHGGGFGVAVGGRGPGGAGGGARGFDAYGPMAYGQMGGFGACRTAAGAARLGAEVEACPSLYFELKGC
eukprot:363248-Chlamydomonas_euryale.AAC.13